MKEINYIGNEFQLFGKEEYVLTNGKANGVKIWHVKNGKGLEMCINLDRGFDIVSLTIKGVNVSYLTANGIVSSKYYDDKKNGFLKSFAAGFLTTCGLTQVGSYNIDNNEELPLHGTYSNIPVINANYIDNEDEMILIGEVLDETIFSHKLKLTRTIKISKKENKFSINDTITNRGDMKTPLQLLYHINIGYPFLNENSVLKINSYKVEARNKHALDDIDNYLTIHEPKANFEEKCYYHYFKDKAKVMLFQPLLNQGIVLTFDSNSLHYLTQWKMLGIRDYVLGLEPINTTPDGRSIIKEKGLLEYIDVNETKSFSFEVNLVDNTYKF